MGKDKMISVEVIVPCSYVSIEKWFTEIQFFSAENMRFFDGAANNNKKFNEEVFFNKISVISTKENFSASFSDSTNEVGIRKTLEAQNTIILYAYLDIEIFDRNKSAIYAIINQLILNQGITAHICMMEDHFWQNIDNLSIYKIKGRSLENIPLTKHKIHKNRTVIDVQKMAGYTEYVNGVWFGAAWKMWFGPGFYQFVTPEIIEKFSDCFSNELIAERCNCITLYENLSDFDNPTSRARQWSFKRAIDFDNLIQRLKEGPRVIDNPAIEINEGQFAHGGIKEMREYYDMEGNNVSKKNADKVLIVEYNEVGQVVWQDEQQLN